MKKKPDEIQSFRRVSDPTPQANNDGAAGGLALRRLPAARRRKQNRAKIPDLAQFPIQRHKPTATARLLNRPRSRVPGSFRSGAADQQRRRGGSGTKASAFRRSKKAQ
jgi:hypothetical protein